MQARAESRGNVSQVTAGSAIPTSVDKYSVCCVYLEFSENSASCAFIPSVSYKFVKSVTLKNNK